MEALMVHLLLYQEETYYVAHCLEFDLVAQGDTVDEAFVNLLDAIELQAEYARETGNLQSLFQPAPTEYWQMLAIAKRYLPQPNGWELPTIISNIECGLVYNYGQAHQISRPIENGA